MSHLLLRLLENFYIYGCGAVLSLAGVNWWRRRRGYRTRADRAHEED